MGISGPDFVRTLEDPVTFLRLRALVLAPKLGVPIEIMDRLIGMVISALGADWLNEVAEDVPGAVPLPIPRHYVGHLVATAGESQIGELLELGQYLESLYSVDGFASALVSLRSAYHQTLLQLAMTTRFQLCGAEIVRLEPPATDGRLADIELMFEAVRYQVECYRPTYKGMNEGIYELVRLEQAVLENTRACSGPYAVAVAFSEVPTPQLRKEAAAVIGRAIREMEADAGSANGRVPAMLIRGPGTVVSLVSTIATPPGTPPFLPRHPEFPHQGDDHVTYMRVGSIPRSEAAGVHASADQGVGTSCVGVWAPEDESSSAKATDPIAAIERFARKIENKMAQTRSTEGHARIVVVDAWETRLVRETGPDTMERLRGKLVRAHKNVATVLLTHREWADDRLRHSYPLLAVGPDDPDGHLSRLVDRLLAVDAA